MKIKMGPDFSIAIHGFGNVGMNAALCARELGLKVVAISDVNGGVYNSNGLDIPKAIEHHKKNKTLNGWADGFPILIRG
jgi:glutamate dehydrogenase (NAD(P)+)